MTFSKIFFVTIIALSPCASYASGSVAEASQIRVLDAGSVKVDGIESPIAERKTEVGGVSQYDCVYEYKINAGMGETYATALQIGESISKFSDYASYCIDSIGGAQVKDGDALKEMEKKRMNATFFFDAEVWQNLPDGSMTVAQEVVPVVMGYEEPMGQIEWTLVEECADTICGYPCGKATAIYGGREWTAWYAPDIPVSAGPWKLQGLPGLIMAAKDSEGLHAFTAISFRSGGTPIVMPDKFNVHFSTRDKVIKRKAEIEEKGMKGVDPSMIESITVMKNSTNGHNIIFNGVTLRERPNGYIPLEKE